MSVNSDTQTSIDRTTFTITFRRTFDAPPEDVFDAWTLPTQICEWWDPTGTRLRECTVDLGPGGRFSFVNASGHGSPFEGVYRLIERPTQLVFDALGSIGTVHLEGGLDSTRMTVTIRCTSAEHLEQFVKLGVDVGTAKTLDNLAAHIAKAP